MDAKICISHASNARVRARRAGRTDPDMPGRSKQIRIAQFPGPSSAHKLSGRPIVAATRPKAMNEELIPRIYREYCWFALLLVIMTVGFIGRPPSGETNARTGAAGVSSASAGHHPP
jgi:hypothetical protein